MSQFSLSLQAKHTARLLVTLLVVSGCTLDFDEFTPYTEENLRNRDKPKMDMAPPLEDMDMLGDPPDVLPPDVDPPPVDSDGDGRVDGEDNCPMTANEDQRDTDENMVGDACDDADADGVADYLYDPDAPEPYRPLDNCLGLANPDQADLDWDGEGDPCDLDADGDGLDAPAEEALGTDVLKSDSDYDGILDGVDDCPLHPSRVNRDGDEDGYGDDCDADDDGDGVYDWLDNCPYIENPTQLPDEPRGADCATDADNDGILDSDDVCPFEPNVEGVTPRCALGVKRWGYEGDHYDLEHNSRGALLSATEGGLRVLYPTQEGPSSWGEESGLPTRRVRRVVSTNHSRVSAWVLMEGTYSVSALRWDSALSRYALTEVPLKSLGVQGRPQAIAAYEGYAWIGTDQGLYQLDAQGARRLLPVEEGAQASVSGLHATSEGRVLSAVGEALYLKGSDGEVRPFGALAGYGEIREIKYFNANQVMVLGSVKAALASKPVDDLATLTVLSSYEVSAYDVIKRDDGLYFATSDGVVYFDNYGRQYRPSARQPGGAVTRSLEPSVTEGRFWTGSSGVASEHYAIWSGYEIPGEPCVRDHVLDGSDWWVVTSNGLYRVESTGEKEALLEQGDLYRVKITADGVWTAGGNLLFQMNGINANQYEIPTVVEPPIKAIEQLGDRICVGGRNGVACAQIVDGYVSAWTTELDADGVSLPYGQVTGLKEQGGLIWVSVQDDQGLGEGGGLAAYNLDTGTYAIQAYTVNNGNVTSQNLYDLDSYGDFIALGSNIGAQVLRNPLNPEPSNIALNQGLPNEAGGSAVLSVDLTSSHLFLSLKPTDGGPQPYGSLVRFTHSLEALNPIDYATAVLYSSADTDILTVPEAQLEGTQLHDLTSPGGYPQLTYSSCGSDAYPGLIGLLDGQGGLYKRVQETTLRVAADHNALIPSPGAHPTWAQAYTSPEGETKVYLTDLADTYPDPYGPSDPRARRSEPSITYPIQSCRRFLEAGEDNPNYRVECLLSENYSASNLNGSWALSGQLFGGAPTEVRGWIIDEDKPLTIRWYATNRGLIRQTNTTTFDEDYPIPGNEEGAPNITSLYSVHHSPNHDLLFVGSDQGLNYSPVLDGGVTQQLWTPVEELKGVKVYEIAENKMTGDLWVATAQGLFKLTLSAGGGSAVSRYGVAQGIPAGKVSHVAVSAQGYVYALHQSGLSRYNGAEWSHYGPRVGSAVDATALLITDGYVWVGGPQGVTRFTE